MGEFSSLFYYIRIIGISFISWWSVLFVEESIMRKPVTFHKLMTNLIT